MVAGRTVEDLIQGYSQAVASAGPDDRMRVELVARLATHYWQPEMTARERTWQALDWLSDLRDFLPAIVEEACARYRRGEPSLRPTPGAIRALCLEVREERMGGRRLALPAPRREEPRPLDPGARAELDAYARSRGYADWEEARDAIFAGTAPRGLASGFMLWGLQQIGAVEGFQTPAAALGVRATPHEAQAVDYEL